MSSKMPNPAPKGPKPSASPAPPPPKRCGGNGYLKGVGLSTPGNDASLPPGFRWAVVYDTPIALHDLEPNEPS